MHSTCEKQSNKAARDPRKHDQLDDIVAKLMVQKAKVYGRVCLAEEYSTSRCMLSIANARALPPIEALLASTMDTWPEDTEDELLAANIRKGEQVRSKGTLEHQRYALKVFFPPSNCSSSSCRCVSVCAGTSPSDALVHKSFCSLRAVEVPHCQRDLSKCRPVLMILIRSRICTQIIDKCLGET